MLNKQQKIQIKDKLKDKKYKNLHNEIFKILLSDDKFKYTSNMSGLYFDINILGECTLNKLNTILHEPNKINNNDNNSKLQYKSYFMEKYSNEINDADKLQNNLRKLKIILK